MSSLLYSISSQDEAWYIPWVCLLWLGLAKICLVKGFPICSNEDGGAKAQPMWWRMDIILPRTQTLNIQPVCKQDLLYFLCTERILWGKIKITNEIIRFINHRTVESDCSHMLQIAKDEIEIKLPRRPDVELLCIPIYSLQVQWEPNLDCASSCCLVDAFSSSFSANEQSTAAFGEFQIPAISALASDISYDSWKHPVVAE